MRVNSLQNTYMTIHDPLLAQQYGGQDAYERLVDDGAFLRLDAVSKMKPIDQLRYYGAYALGYTGVIVGLGIAWDMFSHMEHGMGESIPAAVPLGLGLLVLGEYNPSYIRAQYR